MLYFHLYLLSYFVVLVVLLWIYNFGSGDRVAWHVHDVCINCNEQSWFETYQIQIHLVFGSFT
jgi:hypothetical protein